jgi:hypothetical protein
MQSRFDLIRDKRQEQNGKERQQMQRVHANYRGNEGGLASLNLSVPE